MTEPFYISWMNPTVFISNDVMVIEKKNGLIANLILYFTISDHISVDISYNLKIFYWFQCWAVSVSLLLAHLYSLNRMKTPMWSENRVFFLEFSIIQNEICAYAIYIQLVSTPCLTINSSINFLAIYLQSTLQIAVNINFSGCLRRPFCKDSTPIVSRHR